MGADGYGMSIEISGLCLSNLLYEQVNCFSDSDGFLVGHKKNIVSNAISDNSTNDVLEKTIFEITKIISCPKAASWFDRKCCIDKNIIKDILTKTKSEHEEILGWYKSRRESSLFMSLKERHLTIRLRQHFQSNSFIFLLLTSSNSSLESNSMQCLHSYDFQFFTLKQNEVIASSSIDVTNLGSSIQSDYRMISNISSPSNVFPECFRDVNSSSISAVNSVFDRLNLKSEELKKILFKSEETLEYETQRLLNLKEELQFLKQHKEGKNWQQAPNELDSGHLIDFDVDESCTLPASTTARKVEAWKASDVLASSQCLLTSPIPDNLDLKSSIFDAQIESSI